MAVASTLTKLPLAEWARLIGIHPLHFEGVEFTPNNRSPRTCQSAYSQWDWQQNDRVSREQIAQAVLEAETMLERNLGFRLRPTWETEEWRPTIRPYQREMTFARPVLSTG